jgi:hypothetical protein
MTHSNPTLEQVAQLEARSERLKQAEHDKHPVPAVQPTDAPGVDLEAAAFVVPRDVWFVDGEASKRAERVVPLSVAQAALQSFADMQGRNSLWWAEKLETERQARKEAERDCKAAERELYDSHGNSWHVLANQQRTRAEAAETALAKARNNTQRASDVALRHMLARESTERKLEAQDAAMTVERSERDSFERLYLEEVKATKRKLESAERETAQAKTDRDTAERVLIDAVADAGNWRREAAGLRERCEQAERQVAVLEADDEAHEEWHKLNDSEQLRRNNETWVGVNNMNYERYLKANEQATALRTLLHRLVFDGAIWPGPLRDEAAALLAPPHAGGEEETR